MSEWVERYREIDIMRDPQMRKPYHYTHDGKKIENLDSLAIARTSVDKALDEEERRRREFDKRHPIKEETMKKIQAALDRAQVAYTSEFGRLDYIAVEVFHGKRGGFLRKYADAWLHADVYNKRLIRSTWVELIIKYNLEVDPEGTGGKG